jgi:transposase
MAPGKHRGIQQQGIAKSKIGKAISYALGMWHRIERYIEDGKYEIDNNWVENSIRPVALGRKNYLFAGSHDAAQRAAMIYSLLATCKKNNVEPSAWLTDVLAKIQDQPINKIEDLLPEKWQK